MLVAANVAASEAAVYSSAQNQYQQNQQQQQQNQQQYQYQHYQQQQAFYPYNNSNNNSSNRREEMMDVTGGSTAGTVTTMTTTTGSTNTGPHAHYAAASSSGVVGPPTFASQQQQQQQQLALQQYHQQQYPYHNPHHHNNNNNQQHPYNTSNNHNDSSASSYVSGTTGGGTTLMSSTVDTTTNNNNNKTFQQQQQPPPGGYNNNNNNSDNNLHTNSNDNKNMSSSSWTLFCCPTSSSSALLCSCCYPQPQYNPIAETLEYDYNYDDATKPPQPYPRIRERGEYYLDSYNDQPWSWTFGTNEHNGIWCNSSDQAGTIMSAMVWILLTYSAVTVTLLTVTEGIPVVMGMLYNLLCFMALACHAKTSLTDPGSVPAQSIPCERQRLLRDSHSMCGQCQTFKPPGSHHCRICNRCISRMDHHCPWMNNCVGAANLKHFCLFLIYTWTLAAYALGLFGWNYFFCADEDCTFHPIVLHLVRIMTLLAVGAFLFTSSMLMNVCYGIMTGIGTIDRLKKKATNTMSQSDEEPIQLIDVFGIGPLWTWPLPVDPVFEDYDRVMGYTLPQRLDRERQFCDLKRPLPDIKRNPSMELPKCVNDLLPV